MNREISSIRLRTFFRFDCASPRLRVKPTIVLVIMLCAVMSACVPRRTFENAGSISEAVNLSSKKSPQRNKPLELKKPPWQVWNDDTFGNQDLVDAEAFVGKGELRKALKAYTKAQMSSKELGFAREVSIRRAGTLLKLGNSAKALEVITSFADAYKLPLHALGAQEALVIAFAYEHQGNLDQALAWLGVAQKQSPSNDSPSNDIVTQHSEQAIQRLLRGLNAALLEQQREKWTADPVIGPFVSRERMHRSHGGHQYTQSISDWFLPATYSLDGSDDSLMSEEDIAIASTSDEFVVGALLPLSGRYAEHGKRVKKGIELAVSSNVSPGVNIRLIFGDTAGDATLAAKEYERLVAREGASIVLGPLLVLTTNSVAVESELLGVPIVAFTKREGIPELSQSVFRLGATAQNQASELASYAVNNLGISRFGMLYPDSQSGQELADAFRQELGKYNAELVNQVVYTVDDEESIRGAVSKFENDSINGLFVAENLERAWPGFEMMKSLDMSGITLLGSALWDDVVALRGFGDLLEGAVYVTPFFAHSADVETVAFKNSYRDKFGHEAGLLSAQAFDAARFVLTLAQTTGNSSGRMLGKELLSRGSYNGITGKLMMSKSGDLLRRMSVIRLIDGEPVEVMSKGEVIVSGPETVVGYIADGKQQ